MTHARRKCSSSSKRWGFTGAVTDFGQLILLFGRREMERYEFSFKGPGTIENAPALVFTYKQLDGPEALTLFKANNKGSIAPAENGRRDLGESGKLCSHADHDGGHGERSHNAPLHEEASVDYVMSQYGALLPVSHGPSGTARRQGDRGKSFHLRGFPEVRRF